MSSRVIYFHKATEDASTNNYADINTATIAALAGYTVSSPLEILVVGQKRKPDVEQIRYLGGELSSINLMRREFSMEFKPFTYTASNWDVADMETLIDTFFTSEYLWIDLSSWQDATARAVNYHAANKLIPVVVSGYEVAINPDSGTDTLTATITHRWRNV